MIVKKVLESLSRLIRSKVSNRKIEKDIKVNDYLDALTKLYVVENLECWSPNFRFKTRLRTAPVRFL